MNRRSFWKTLVVAPIAAAAGVAVVASNDALHFRGLLGIIQNSTVGNYGGIDRSAAGNDFWETSINTDAGGALTEEMWLKAYRVRQGRARTLNP